MNTPLRLYQYINILSLDVVAGAIVCSLFFARIFEVSVPFYGLGALGLSVWIIYTVDHLRDALLIPKPASTDRHLFHQQNFRIILAVVAIAVLCDIILVWHLRVMVLEYGFILGSLVGVYLLFQRYLRFLKEIFVACLYTAGILLPSLVVHKWQLQPLHSLLIGQFCVTALTNLLLFSLFDFVPDRVHQQHSFVTSFGPETTRATILTLGILNILVSLVLVPSDIKVSLIFLAMNVMLLCILIFQRKLVCKNYYRMLGDAVFFLPFLHLL
jgi:hypothetical protein